MVSKISASAPKPATVTRPILEAQLTTFGVIAALIWGLGLACVTGVSFDDVQSVVEFEDSNPLTVNASSGDWNTNMCVSNRPGTWMFMLFFSSAVAMSITSLTLLITVRLYKSLRLLLIHDDDTAVAKAWYMQFSDEMMLIEHLLYVSFASIWFSGVSVTMLSLNHCWAAYASGVFLSCLLLFFLYISVKISRQDQSTRMAIAKMRSDSAVSDLNA